jgi:hypothetical protein
LLLKSLIFDTKSQRCCFEGIEESASKPDEADNIAGKIE